MSSPSTEPPSPARVRIPWRVVGVLLAFAALASAALLLDFEWQAVGDFLAALNLPLLLVALATLPVVGFPVTATYLTLGAVLGPVWGGVAVAGVTAVHLLLTHALGQSLLRGRLGERCRAWRDRLPAIPPNEKATLLALIVILPGPPYLVRNALMVLAEVPLRLRLALGLPLYVLRSYATLLLGALAREPQAGVLYAAAGLFGLKLLASLLLFRRLRRRVSPEAAEAPATERPAWLGRLLVVAALAAAVGLALWLRGPGVLDELMAWVSGLNAALVVAAVTLLPLVGVPVSAMHTIAGARFGLPAGLALVAGSLLAQLAASRWIVRLAPGLFRGRFLALRQRLPPSAHRPLALFTLLVPGAPFFAQNYVLVLAGVPAPVYYGYGFTLHFARSLIAVLFGGWSGHLTPARGIALGLYALTVTAGCALALRRLRRQARGPRPTAGDPRPGA